MAEAAIVVEPGGTADACVIWLHGLGADGHDFEPIVPELHLPHTLGVRFVFPHAPRIPVTLNGGMVMPAWYDIRELSIDRKVDTEQLTASAVAVQRLLDRELERGIDSRRIVVAGFSQGGAVGIHAALTYPQALAGLLVLSGYFATHASIEPHAANAGLAVQLCHGTFDPVVPEALGRHAFEQLQALGYAAGYKTYPMDHSVCPPEIADISAWLQARLSPPR